MKMTKQTLKVNLYEIVSRAVEAGITYGYKRAHKHTETPTEDEFMEAINSAVMSELSDVIDFGPGEDK